MITHSSASPGLRTGGRKREGCDGSATPVLIARLTVALTAGLTAGLTTGLVFPGSAH